MPIYEYVCKACGKRSSLLFRSYSSIEAKPRCPHCNSLKLRRALSAPGLIRARSASDSSGELRAVDPRKAVESLSRQYDQAGIDPGGGFEEVAKLAARGDSPDTLKEAVQEAKQNEKKKATAKKSKKK
jgi:putative FmdB family regulatory protein